MSEDYREQGFTMDWKRAAQLNRQIEKDKMSEHTKGLLRREAKIAASEDHQGFMVYDEKGSRVAEFYPRDEDGIEGQANADLFMQAPAMRELLERVSVWYEVRDLDGHESFADIIADTKTLLEKGGR